MKKFYTSMLCCLLGYSVLAQQDLDEILVAPSEGISEEALEQLMQVYTQPIAINAITAEQLTLLGVLSKAQIQNFITYRDVYGPFLSLYEIQVIPLFDKATIERLLPYVYFSLPNRTFAQDWQQAQHRLIFRTSQYLEQKKGFTPPDTRSKVRYEGSPLRTLLRYRLAVPKRLSLGFSFEKDEGEKTWNDFGSGYLQIQNRGVVQQVILGDYTAQFGQGLVAGAGFYLGKSSETVLFARRNQTGIRPYTSTMEMNFLRGVAVEWQWKNWQMTQLVSFVKRDANVEQSDSSRWVTSLQTSGLHRTASEIADYHALYERNMASSLTYSWNGKRSFVGALYWHTAYDMPLLKADKLYNQYAFAGTQNALASVCYNVALGSYYAFGEMARSQNGGYGLLAGWVGSLGKKIDMSLIFRKYTPDFQSLYANAFSENSQNVNETGLYLGWKYTPNRRWTVTAYGDIFTFPWYKYLIDKAPTNGFEILGKGQFQPKKTIKYALQARLENKEENVSIEESYVDSKGKVRTRSITEVRPRYKWSVNGLFWRKLSPQLSVQSRVLASSFTFQHLPTTYGWAMCQDVKWDLGALAFSARLAYFHTDDYDNRQYVYESDVMYAYSFPAYNGVGWRYYVNLSYHLHKHLSLWLRWSRTDLFNARTYGSGLDEIAVPHRSELKLQLRWEMMN